MGFFSDFHQKQNVDNVAGFRTNRDSETGKIREKEEKNTFTTRAQATLSTFGGGHQTKEATQPRNIDVVDNPRQQKSACLPVPADLSSLPDACPMVTGDGCPPGCRFETKFFVRMLEQGILPDPAVGCPLVHVCGLVPDRPQEDRQPSPLTCLGHECQHVSRGPETAALRCEKADAEVIDMAECPTGRWLRDLPRPTKQIGTPHGVPGDCENCPACDKERMMCHYTAFFECRASHGVPCVQARTSCPRGGEKR